MDSPQDSTDSRYEERPSISELRARGFGSISLEDAYFVLGDQTRSASNRELTPEEIKYQILESI